MWTADREYEQPIKYMDLNRSGGSFVANLTLRLSPDLEDPSVTFENAVTNEVAGPYIQFVEQGVRSFVGRMAAAGRPVGHLRVTLIGITIHPVDAKARRFVQAAEMALTQAFEKVGVEL